MIHEAAGPILASACAELGALRARFSSHSKDAFKTRYAKFLIPTERHRSLSPNQASRNVIENDNTQTLYGHTTGRGLAQGSPIGGLKLASTNNSHEAFHSLGPVSQQSLGFNFYQEEPPTSVGMNGHCFQQQDSYLPAHDDGFDYASSSMKDATSMFQTSNFASSDIPWDSILDFNSPSNTQAVEILGASAPEQLANAPLTASLPSAPSLQVRVQNRAAFDTRARAA